MSTIMIRCPTAGEQVSTGILVDRVTSARIPSIRARMRCPACGAEHAWTRLEACLAEAPFRDASRNGRKCRRWRDGATSLLPRAAMPARRVGKQSFFPRRR